MDFNRRVFLGAAGAVTASGVLAGCAGFSRPSGSSGADELSFTTWGSEAEEAAFRASIAAFEEANPGTSITLNLVPYEQMFENIDAQLQSNTAPDVFRVDYSTLGAYSSQDQLLDLSSYFDVADADAFIPAFWRAVQFEGTPFGVPHQTDTSAVLYNRAAFEAAGITSVPDTLETAWTWQEFEQVAQQLRDSLPADRYPFAYNWQQAGVTRWLSWLFQAGGRFLEDDLVTPAIDSPEGRKALDFTKSFFTKNFVPANSSVKSSTYASDSFYSETSAMLFAGNFLLPDVDSFANFEWGATYMPRDVRAASDLGGNALVATASTEKAELAAEFLAFMVSEEQMRNFCAATTELPTLQSLVGADIDFATRPDIMPIFVEQATTIQESDVAQLASPDMASINTVLSDQLELAFTQGQSTDETLAKISEGIAAATA
ncbi:ABC transporter substrate-binding protein [Planctomonas psychrotolerans]|uniref:ABC transporter substrate-binding protein n=1 Tax=Planctomonas psychrotolerans TaxID=2528712 RepID=UPI00123B5FD8|nr:sugar ABC transporter substrate-binding protein [Planctomonas psychrotolerans]